MLFGVKNASEVFIENLDLEIHRRLGDRGAAGVKQCARYIEFLRSILREGGRREQGEDSRQTKQNQFGFIQKLSQPTFLSRNTVVLAIAGSLNHALLTYILSEKRGLALIPGSLLYRLYGSVPF